MMGVYTSTSRVGRRRKPDAELKRPRDTVKPRIINPAGSKAWADLDNEQPVLTMARFAQQHSAYMTRLAQCKAALRDVAPLKLMPLRDYPVEIRHFGCAIIADAIYCIQAEREEMKVKAERGRRVYSEE